MMRSSTLILRGHFPLFVSSRRTSASRWQAARRRATVVPSAALNHDEPRRLTVVHFNDVYDISPRSMDPVGGAARFTHLVRQLSAESPLVLFSGDCLNPSLLSAFTRGEQMVPIMNSIGVHAAAVGNHDFDFGVEVLRQHMTSFKFPWLLSNVLDVHTNEPLGGAHRSLVLEWQGVRVGLVGLVEREWLLTIPSLEADKDILFLDFVEEGRKLARELRAQGADIVVALTHMRAPNDHLLAAEVPEIQLVLGGHDHDYLVERTEPHGTMLIKSGTDFREFSVIRLKVPPAGPAPTANGAAAGAAGVPPRLELTCEKVDVVASTPEAPDVAAVVADYQAVMGTRMDEPLGRSFLDLDAKFDTVRTRESNVGNLLGDIMRLGLGADAAFLNGGTIRSDAMHAAGRLTMRDFVSMLPFTDELVVLRLSGADVLMALETGVSSWPKREGRFLQVSGISFKFDSERPPGGRVLRDSVVIAGEPLDLDRVYKVATKAYLRSGKDGFDALKRAQVEVDGETAPRLATLCHYLLSRIEQLNIEQGCNTDDSANARQRGEKLVNGSANGASVNGSSVAVAPAAVQSGSRRRSLFAVSEAPLPPAPCAHGLDALYRYDRVSGQFGIAPEVEGRIVNVATQKS